MSHRGCFYIHLRLLSLYCYSHSPNYLFKPILLSVKHYTLGHILAASSISACSAIKAHCVSVMPHPALGAIVNLCKHQQCCSIPQGPTPIKWFSASMRVHDYFILLVTSTGKAKLGNLYFKCIVQKRPIHSQ